MTAQDRRRILISARADDLAALGDGWDGCGSKAPTRAALWAAELLLDGWRIEPQPDGGVTVCWGDQVTARIRPWGQVEPL